MLPCKCGMRTIGGMKWSEILWEKPNTSFVIEGFNFIQKGSDFQMAK